MTIETKHKKKEEVSFKKRNPVKQCHVIFDENNVWLVIPNLSREKW